MKIITIGTCGQVLLTNTPSVVKENLNSTKGDTPLYNEKLNDEDLERSFRSIDKILFRF